MVADCFHIDRPERVAVIDGLAVLIDRLAIHRGVSAHGVPLTAVPILVDLVVPARRGVLGW